MNEQNVSLERSLAELGWTGVPLQSVLANVLWLFVSLGLDNTSVLRHVRENALTQNCAGACEELLAIICDEARKAGRFDVLRRPRVMSVEEALERVEDFLSGA